MVANLQRFRSWFIFLSLTLTIAACGGDDDGPDPTPTPTPDDETPASFAFSTAVDAALGATVESNTVTIDDINVAVAVTIVDGEYSINDGAFSSTSGVINEGDTLTLRGTAASEFSSDVIVGVTVGTVTETFTITTVVQDTAPEAFSFTSVADVALSATAESEAVTISGINTTTPVSIQNGEYKIDDGSFTSDAGTIENGQSIQVRTTASGTFTTAVVATLNVGGVEGTFTATTVAQDITPEDFGFTAVTQAPFDALIGSSTATITGITGAVPISVQNGWYRIDSGAATTEVGTITNGQSVIVSGESSAEFETETVVTLTVGNVIRTFSITTAARDVVPDEFSFSAETGAELDTQYESEVKTISGINDTATISITNGEYRIDGGAYTSANGAIENGQEVQVRTTSSSAADTEVQAMLTVGGLARVYSVTTMADEEAPTASIAFPPPSSLTEGTTITVRGTASDNLSDVTSVTVKGGATDAVATSTDDFATWEAVVTLTADSVNALSVTATDSADNTGDDLASVSVKQDASLADFPDGNLPMTLPVGMTLDLVNDRAFISDAYANDDANDMIFELDLVTGARSLISNNSNGNLSYPMRRTEGLLYDTANEIFYGIEALNEFAFTLDIATGERTVFSSATIPDSENRFASNPTTIIQHPKDADKLIVESGSQIFSVNKINGAREIISNNIVPDGENFLGDSEAVIYDSKNDYLLVFDSGFDVIVRVSLVDGARTYLSQTLNDSVFLPNNDLPHLNDSRSFVLDVQRNRVIVADYTTPHLIAVDIDSGIRSIFSDSTTPDNTNAFMVTEEIKFDNTLGYAFVLDSGHDAVMAVDIVSGERVFISKASTED